MISGFTAIKNATTIQLGKRINLIDGPGNDVKLSIPRGKSKEQIFLRIQFNKSFIYSSFHIAIDFMLNPDYESDILALGLLHPDIAADNDQAYVTLHISSDTAFKLNVREL